ncbi:MAG: hypothetical protein RMK98_08215 [Bacteroidia bacterium]|nr:hypothetical protein [Bacteroidia bacterium]
MRWRGIGLGVLFVVVGCQSSSTSPTSSMQVPEKGLAIPVEKLSVPYCPECEMHFDKFAIADTIIHQDKLYGFCSKECKASFKKRMGI